MAGKLIVLNGPSSSGKTTLAKAFTKQRRDYFHASVDDFDLFIEKIEDREDNHLIPIETDFLFHKTVKVILDQGINIILDTVLTTPDQMIELLEVFKDHGIKVVKVFADHETLRKREMNRNDRRIGLACSQVESIHALDHFIHCSIDSSNQQIDELVRQLLIIADTFVK